MASNNILFYSNDSRPCQTLIALMRSEDLLKYFNLICVDQYPQQNITIVPSLIIRNSSSKIEGNDTFKWISNIKQWKHNMMLSQMSNDFISQNNLISNNLQMNSSVLPYSANEMSGFSDDFALLHSDNALPQAFVETDFKKKHGEDKLLIFTPDSENQKLSQEAYVRLANNLQHEREKFDKDHEKKMNEYLKAGSSDHQSTGFKNSSANNTKGNWGYR